MENLACPQKIFWVLKKSFNYASSIKKMNFSSEGNKKIEYGMTSTQKKFFIF